MEQTGLLYQTMVLKTILQNPLSEYELIDNKEINLVCEAIHLVISNNIVLFDGVFLQAI